MTYTLSCTGPGGSVSRTVDVSVTNVPAETPTLNFWPDAYSVLSGNSTDLNWYTTNVTSCTASGDWSESSIALPSSSWPTGPLTAAKTYFLECFNSDGVSTGKKSVTVSSNAVPLSELTLCTDDGSGNQIKAPVSQGLSIGDTYDLYPHYGPNGDCSDTEATSASWSEDTSSNVISLSGSSPKTVTASASGTEAVSASYSGASDSVSFIVASPCTSSTCTAEEEAEHCSGEEFVINDGCNGTKTCIGTRNCDFNWREVAPGD
jgi:hypothetical protein